MEVCECQTEKNKETRDASDVAFNRHDVMPHYRKVYRTSGLKKDKAPVRMGDLAGRTDQRSKHPRVSSHHKPPPAAV